MKRLFFSTLVFLLALSAMAQVADGYYRLQNFMTDRHIIVLDNKSKGINVNDNTIDADALRTWSSFDDVLTEPGTIVYFKNVGGNQYNLRTQGAECYSFVGRYLNMIPGGAGTWRAYGEAAGTQVFISDEEGAGITKGFIMLNGSQNYQKWWVKPVEASGDNYFGVKGEVNVGGQYYTTLYADFPFTFYSSGMKAYIVNMVDDNLAVWQEVSGTVAAGTPVIIACAGQQPTNNRLSISATDGQQPANNLLKGVYFNSSDFYKSTAYHYNVTPYDPSTMRVLGVTSDGKLGLIKATNMELLPRNRAYITVPAGSADEIRLVTQAEYEQEIAKDAVTITANNKMRYYGDANPEFDYTVVGDLKGEPQLSCEANIASPVGTYDIVVSKGTVTNRHLTLNNGRLTVAKAPLIVAAQSYVIKQTDPLPQFAADFNGFKNGQNESVLQGELTFTCDLPEGKYLPVGSYPITVSGVTADNYLVSFRPGVLTVRAADPITVKATDVQKVYGAAVPELQWTMTGGSVEGQPEITCEVSESSPVGTYSITIGAGTIDYPNLKLTDGTFTVTPAPLTISAGTYSIRQTDERPAFQATYEGFVLDETEAVLTQLPVFQTDAPDDNTPGEYTVTVSGAEAPNYDISYVNGRLIISEVDQLTIVATDLTMTYGDAEVPQLTYTMSGVDQTEFTGEPVLTCEVTSATPAGTYPIVLEKGTIDYPNVKLVNATFTVNKAPLTASVGSYVREQGELNPEFEILYEGFRNGDDASVLEQVPVATTEATLDSEPGVYDIIVSGGEAANYVFSYVNGVLKVQIPEAIKAITFRSPVDIYTVTGRLVRVQTTTAAGLPRGIYIVGGRKLIIN